MSTTDLLQEMLDVSKVLVEDHTDPLRRVQTFVVNYRMYDRLRRLLGKLAEPIDPIAQVAALEIETSSRVPVFVAWLLDRDRKMIGFFNFATGDVVLFDAQRPSEVTV